MFFTRKQQGYIFFTVNGLFLLTLLAFPFYRDYLAATTLTSCKFHIVTGLYCMGCGATRAFNALIHFKLLKALQYNPSIPIGAFLFIIYEITIIFYLIKRKPRPVLIKSWMIWTFFGLWLAYTIVRNILLVNGVDIVLGTGL